MIDHGRRALTRLGLHASLGLGLLGAADRGKGRKGAGDSGTASCASFRRSARKKASSRAGASASSSERITSPIKW